jgi:V/A-type H+-transporting ATPase subunit A
MDFVILQQDAFDEIDAQSSIERQKYMLEKVIGIYHTDFSFEHFEEVNEFFKRVIDTLRQMNYSEFKSDQFHQYEKELEQIIEERKG